MAATTVNSKQKGVAFAINNNGDLTLRFSRLDPTAQHMDELGDIMVCLSNFPNCDVVDYGLFVGILDSDATPLNTLDLYIADASGVLLKALITATTIGQTAGGTSSFKDGGASGITTAIRQAALGYNIPAGSQLLLKTSAASATAAIAEISGFITIRAHRGGYV